MRVYTEKERHGKLIFKTYRKRFLSGRAIFFFIFFTSILIRGRKKNINSILDQFDKSKSERPVRKLSSKKKSSNCFISSDD